MTRFCLALASVVLVAGCHQTTLGPPSEAYKKASNAYVALLDKDGPTAVFTDPGIPQIQALLAQVPANSVDIEAARSLQKTLTDGIAAAEKAARAHDAAVAEVAKPAVIDTAPAGEPPPPIAAPVAPAAAPKAPVAGAGPHPGMSAADFQSKFGDCFSPEAQFTDDTGHAGEAYALAPSCAGTYAAMANQLVLVSGDKVLSIVPRSTIKSTQKLTMTHAKVVPGAPSPAAPPPQQAAQPVPAPVDPNTIDRAVTAPDTQVAAPDNVTGVLDPREKLPGER